MKNFFPPESILLSKNPPIKMWWLEVKITCLNCKKFPCCSVRRSFEDTFRNYDGQHCSAGTIRPMFSRGRPWIQRTVLQCPCGLRTSHKRHRVPWKPEGVAYELRWRHGEPSLSRRKFMVIVQKVFVASESWEEIGREWLKYRFTSKMRL